jgi:selenide,water dikinase
LELLQGIGGGKIGMDCSIVPLRQQGLSMLSTTDFFYPLVDDPYEQGKVGACNVLSDMYALGVVDIDNVLMILASSSEMDSKSRDIVTRKMIEGFSDLCKSAGVEVTGGQTVLNPWPIIGGTAMSCCASNQFILPVNAVPGDVIVLTKPLGTQVAVNVNEWIQLEDQSYWKKTQEVLTLEEANEAYRIAANSMTRLNRNAAKLMHKYGAHAATDVTGFGILGHSNNLAKNQIAAVEFHIHTLPIIKKMEEVDRIFPFFDLVKGYSAETSGGLFIAMDATNAEAFCHDLEEMDHLPAWIVGKVVKGQDPKNNCAVISNNVKIIHV